MVVELFLDGVKVDAGFDDESGAKFDDKEVGGYSRENFFESSK